MIDHIGIAVGDFEVSKRFYVKALTSIGYSLVMEVSAEQTGTTSRPCAMNPGKRSAPVGGVKR